MLLDTPICDFGQKAPDFALRDPDGVEFSLNDVMGPNGLLIAFICNHCPYVEAIADRFAADAKVLISEGVGVVAIMPNDYQRVQADSPPEMKKFADAHGFEFPYVIDDDQSVARAYGAVCTPDFFGYNNAFELQYRGRIDDKKMQEATAGRVPEMIDAMRLIAAGGHGPETQHPSMGCSIKWRE